MAIGLPLRKYLEEDEGFTGWFPDDDTPHRPVKRNDTFHMLGHVMRVSTVKKTPFPDKIRVFLICNCCTQYPVKLEILEKDLNNVTLDKL